ncbi:MAG: serine/threonine protein kinase [Bryobacterales bacterium]|nr:serine/threonine protein kinase [Bryobacterales bacterium]
MIGEKLGHYEITAKIGKGGMGVVYRAMDTLIGRDVALKTIHLNEIEDPNERQFLKERLFREAKSAGILSHPNIVTVYQIGEQDGLTYIAMEFVEGFNLGELLAREPRPTMELLLSVFDQTAVALDYAHSRGVVHRDIKPGNIIVRPDGVAKIADFGVAKISSQNVTRAGMALGTPHYMSPEQFHGRAIDGRSDQYSLGVMVYEIFTGGKKPFTADSIHGLMYKILHEEPQPRRDNPELSVGVEAALRRALAKEPDQRFPSCSDFIAELRSLSGILPVTFSVESGMRTGSTASPSGRTGMGTPMPSPVPPVTLRPATPGSGIHLPPPPPAAPGLPPPPLPPMGTGSGSVGFDPFDPARSVPGSLRPDSGGFSAGGFPTPASGTGIPGGSVPLPPPPGAPPSPFANELPTPVTGVPTGLPPSVPGGSGATAGAPPAPVPPTPVPPAPTSSGPTSSSTAPPAKGGAKGGDAKATAGKKAPAAPKPAPVASGAAKSTSKSPLVLVAALVVLLLVIGGIVAALLMRSSGEAEQAAQTPPAPVVVEQPVVETPPAPEPTPEPEPEPEATAGQQAPASPPPQITAFGAEPATINQGESAALNWTTSNTNTVQINPGFARLPGAGQRTVTPTETTKYLLIARGYGGRTQREITVTVVPRAPTPQQPKPGSAKPNAWTLDMLVRALESGQDVVKMDNLMVRVGLNGVAFAVTPDAQSAILAAGERGGRSREEVMKIVELARKSSQR